MGGTLYGTGAGLRPGDGDRNVRSLIEPTLGVRVSSRLLPVAEDTDGLRRERRFDCTSATFVGLVGRDLSAAAAAAEESDASEARRLNAEAAAVAALTLAVSLVKGCGERTRYMVSTA